MGMGPIVLSSLLIMAIGGCADGGSPRLDVLVNLGEMAAAPDDLVIFVRMGGELADRGRRK